MFRVFASIGSVEFMRLGFKIQGLGFIVLDSGPVFVLGFEFRFSRFNTGFGVQLGFRICGWIECLLRCLEERQEN